MRASKLSNPLVHSRVHMRAAAASTAALAPTALQATGPHVHACVHMHVLLLLQAAAWHPPPRVQASRVMRFIRMARLLKVVKMMRLPRVLKQLEELIGRAVLSMTSFIVIGLLSIHWMACIFWFVGSLEHRKGDSWIHRYNLLHSSDSVQ
jgi:hypothetical protein